MDELGSPLVSIALCTYNGACYLGEQLDSLLAQTYRNIEIVAVDDCSSDETVSLLNVYAQRDARMRVVINSVNVGFKRNFEIAMLQCRGDYIAPSDQDDIWLPGKIATLLEWIGDKPMAYCDSEFVDAAGKSIGRKLSDEFNMTSIADPAIFAFANCVSGHAMLFRRELLTAMGPVPSGFFHDWWLAAVAAVSGGVIYCDEVLVRYRQHAAAVTYECKTRQVSNHRRQPGFRSEDLREIGDRLEALITLPGAQKPFLQRLRDLWRAREAQWLSIPLAWFLIRHCGRLYALTEKSSFKLMRKSVKYMWGLRLKRLTNPHAYSD